jgi:hypothetical protein
MSQFDPGTARFLTQGLQAGLGLGMDAQQIEMQRARQRMFEQQAAEEAQMRLRQREANKRLTGALFQKRGQAPTMAGGQLAAAVTATQPQFSGAASMGQDAFSSMLRGGYPAQQQQQGGGGVMPQMDPLDAISPDDVADADPRFQQAYFNAKADRQSQQEEYDQTNKLFGYMNRTGMMRAASPAMVERFMKFGLSIPEDQQPPWLREKMKDEGEGLKRDYIVMLKNMGVVDDDSQSILNPSMGGSSSGFQVPGVGLNRRRYKLSELEKASPELVRMIFEQAQKEQVQAQRVNEQRMRQEAEMRQAQAQQQQEQARLEAQAKLVGMDPARFGMLTPIQQGQMAMGGGDGFTPAQELNARRQALKTEQTAALSEYRAINGQKTDSGTMILGLPIPPSAAHIKIAQAMEGKPMGTEYDSDEWFGDESAATTDKIRASVDAWKRYQAATSSLTTLDQMATPENGYVGQQMPIGGGGADYAPAGGGYPVASETEFLERLDDEFVRRYGVEPDPSNPDHRAKSQALFAEMQQAPTGSRP